MELLEPNFQTLPYNDTVNDLGYTANISANMVSFDQFRPQLVFHSFSQQDDDWVVLIEQKVSGKRSPNYIVKKKEIRVFRIGRTSDSQRLIKLPNAFESVLSFYRVRGLFAVSFPNAEEADRNGTIFLIELCDPKETIEGCSGQKTLAYCMASESDTEPLNKVSTSETKT